MSNALQGPNPSNLAEAIRAAYDQADPGRARFWVWLNNGWVRLSLADGQALEWWTGGLTDEGFSNQDHRFSRCGSVITWEETTQSRDCDGRFDCYSVCSTLTTELKARDMAADVPVLAELNAGIFAPMWESGDRSQRDYSAEAAGY
jgi:hypothetical protein